ncbi:helix-turn-helix transcriptional regulator [Gluconobacter sp. OJB]|uniref:helix-turn-helix domain-containing protein n=1 Tax=Gluconobacter sp. OJB TaxID=3145196 RepID=UPI0031F8C748
MRSDVEGIAPQTIRQARLDAGLTQVSAASLVHVTPLTWKRWESGDRTMHPAFWELFALKVEADRVRQGNVQPRRMPRYTMAELLAVSEYPTEPDAESRDWVAGEATGKEIL